MLPHCEEGKEVAREREGRRRERRAIEAVVVVVIGFGILKRRDCVWFVRLFVFSDFFWCFFDYPCFLLSIAVIVLAVVVVSSISSCITTTLVVGRM